MMNCLTKKIIKQNNKNRIKYGNSITCTLLLRIVARSCLVCGHIAHKRQGESKVYVCRCCAVVDGSAKYSQADLMAYASSAFFKIGKKRKSIAQFLSIVFETYFPGGEGFVYKKMPGAKG